MARQSKEFILAKHVRTARREDSMHGEAGHLLGAYDKRKHSGLRKQKEEEGSRKKKEQEEDKKRDVLNNMPD